MTIKRIKNNVAFHCDLKGCNEGMETEEDDFQEGSAAAKDAGWQFRKRGGVWKHFCCRAHEEMDYRGQELVG